VNISLTAAAFVCGAAGAISLAIARRTGEGRTDWFHGRPELVPIFERLYRWIGFAGLTMALLLAVLAFASGTLASFSD